VKPFATIEYEVFRYSAILAAKQVSNDACKYLIEQLPTLEQIKNSTQVENKIVTDHQKVAKELEPLIKFIDFNKIKGQILANIIEPLEIIPTEIILSVYRHKVISKCDSDLNNIRGILPSDYVWDESACGSKLVIEDNGKVVRAQNDCNKHQSVKSKVTLDKKGIFEWNVIIEKDCGFAWIGVCTQEYLNYEKFSASQPAVWVLGSSGRCCNSSKSVNYCPPFGDGSKITVHLDMNKRTCAFTVNGTKYPEVLEWNNLPSKLYPVVGLRDPGCFRIQPYQKFIFN
jgi:hypothetical protein